VPFYSSGQPRDALVEGNQFDLGNPGKEVEGRYMGLKELDVEKDSVLSAIAAIEASGVMGMS
jgi:hypothetical protein